MVSALVDGVDLVVVATPGPVPAGTARSLMSRARRRGCVLIPTRACPACDLMIELVERRWLGLGSGRGRLRRQEVTLRSIGRGRAAQERRTATSLPPPSVADRVGCRPGETRAEVDRALARLQDPPVGPVLPDRPPQRAVQPEVQDPWAALTKRMHQPGR